MKAKIWTTAALLSVALLPGLSQARDTAHFLDFQSVVNEATQAGRLDGSVKFYLNKTPAGAQIINANVTTSQKNPGWPSRRFGEVLPEQDPGRCSDHQRQCHHQPEDQRLQQDR